MKSATKLIFTFILLLAFQLQYVNAQNQPATKPLSEQQCRDLVKSRDYDAMGAFDTVYYSPDIVLAVYVKDGKLGLINNFGKEVTPAIYTDFPTLNRDRWNNIRYKHNVLIVKTDKYGLIDVKGNVLVAPTYIYINDLYESDTAYVTDPRNELCILNGYKVYLRSAGFVATTDKRQEHHFNSYGERVPILKAMQDQLEESLEFHSGGMPGPKVITPKTTVYGRIATRQIGNFIGYRNEESNKCGVMNVITGDTIVPFKYDNVSINEWYEIGFTLWEPGPDGKIAVQKHGMADTLGEMIFEPVYDKILRFNGVIQVVKDGQMALFSSADYSQLTDYIYGPKMSSGNGTFIVLTKDGGAGLVNMKGEELTTFEYSRFLFPDFYDLPFRMIIAEKDGLQELMDYEGNVLIPFKYSRIYPECNIRTGSSQPLEFGTNFISGVQNRFFIVGLAGGDQDWNGSLYKFGLVDTGYNEIIPCIYDRIIKCDGDILIVKKGQSYALLNWKTGELITDWQADEIGQIRGKYFLIRKEGKYGLVDMSGDVVIPFEHEIKFNISEPYPGLTRVYYYSGEEFLYDGYGNRAQISEARE